MKDLDFERELTVREVGDRLSLSANTICTVERKAMEKFKKALQDKGIKLEDLIDTNNIKGLTR